MDTTPWHDWGSGRIDICRFGNEAELRDRPLESASREDGIKSCIINVTSRREHRCRECSVSRLGRTNTGAEADKRTIAKI